MANDRSPAHWFKSSYSNNGGNCVEWIPGTPACTSIPVRDSKCPDGPTLGFSTHGWTGFVTALKNGAIDG